MRRMIAVAVSLVMLLGLAACGQGGKTAETPQSSGAVQLANPWRDVTEEEAKALCPVSFRVPEGAQNAVWSVMDSAADPSGVPGALVQLSFDLDGNSFTAREQRTADKEADLSGMYYTWTVQDEATLRSWSGEGMACKCFRFVGENEYADLCTWFDAASGVAYSLGVAAKDLDGFDLLAIAEAMAPTGGEQ